MDFQIVESYPSFIFNLTVRPLYSKAIYRFFLFIEFGLKSGFQLDNKSAIEVAIH